MREDNLLSLSYGRIVRRDINANEGLLPESFETYQIVEPGDTVFRLTDLQNDQRSLRTALVEERGIITSAYLALEPTGVLPKYFAYLVRAFDQDKTFYRMGSGLRQSLKFEELRRLPVFVPPYEEQCRIAAFLDHETARIDELVREQERLIKNLKNRLSAIAWNAIHQGLNPAVSNEMDAELNVIGTHPTHWDVVPLKYLVSFASGNTPTRDVEEYWGGEIPWVTAKDMKVLDLYDSQDGITKAATVTGGARVLPAGCVITVVRGMILAHTLPVAVSRVPLAINQDLKALVPGPRITPEYLREVLLAKEAESLSRLGEAAHGTKALRMDQWTSLEIPVPPIEEQAEIVATIERQRSQANALMTSVREASTLLVERRSALISAAVTGQLDLSEWQQPKLDAVAEVA